MQSQVSVKSMGSRDLGSMGLDNVWWLIPFFTIVSTIKYFKLFAKNCLGVKVLVWWLVHLPGKQEAQVLIMAMVMVTTKPPFHPLDDSSFLCTC